jgi:fatty-acyl-CoA synthase
LLLERAQRLAGRLPRLRHILELSSWRETAGATRGGGGRLPEVGASDPFLLQYTSGTTGRPKGALISHRAALNAGRLSGLRLQPGRDEIYLSPLPLHHVGGSVSIVLGALGVGGAYVVVPVYDPAEVLDLLERTEATHAGLVPTMWLDMMAEPSFRQRKFALRTVMGGGSKVPPSMVRRIEEELGVLVAIGYGQSESVSITQTWLDDSDLDKAETIGRPLPQREVRVVRPGTSSLVRIGEVGELCTRSPLVMDGYFELPDATAEVIDPQGWLRTGDLGSMDDRGVITFCGRTRELIIRGGENLYPREIEEALVLHPEIIDVAVVGAPDERWGEEVAAFVRLAPGSTLTEEAVRAYARSVLAPFKVPRHWRMVSDFPLTASGKIKKFELRSRLVGELGGSPAGPPRSAS